jgi:hypothetical protein
MIQKNMMKSLIVILITLSSISLSAQKVLNDEYSKYYNFNTSQLNIAADEDDPGTGEEGGGTVEDVPVPIDTNLIYLLFAGISIGAFYYRNCRQEI